MSIFTDKKELGKAGEDVSCIYLEQIGYRIIERNFTCRQGEIDIVAKDKDEYVFIEVKTRSNFNFGRTKDLSSCFLEDSRLPYRRGCTELRC